MAKIHAGFADQDYWSKLTKEERHWLMTFNKNYYGSFYNRDENVINDIEGKRATWNDSNRRRRDITTLVQASIPLYKDGEGNGVLGTAVPLNKIIAHGDTYMPMEEVVSGIKDPRLVEEAMLAHIDGEEK